jgi:hypothetical protein
MKLGEAKRLAEQVEGAEREFDHAWTRRRNIASVAAMVLGMPALAILWKLGGAEMLPPGFFLACSATGALGIGAFTESIRARVKRTQGMGGPDVRVLRKCRELPQLPERVARPLERALDAYRGISRISEDSVWREAGFPVDGALTKAADHLVALLDWGRRLGEVGGTVERLHERREASADQLRGQYETQVGRLEAAVEALHGLEVKVSTAFVQLGAVSAGSPSSAVVDRLGAEFDALSEVFGGESLTVLPAAGATPAAALKVGRG